MAITFFQGIQYSLSPCARHIILLWTGPCVILSYRCKRHRVTFFSIPLFMFWSASHTKSPAIPLVTTMEVSSSIYLNSERKPLEERSRLHMKPTIEYKWSFFAQCYVCAYVWVILLVADLGEEHISQDELICTMFYDDSNKQQKHKTPDLVWKLPFRCCKYSLPPTIPPSINTKWKS